MNILLVRVWLAALLLPLAAMPGQVRIACIGDSITEGAGLSNPTLESYPTRLQRLLGTNDFIVRNFGLSGRTLLKKGDYPYWRESAYTQSRAWEPDIVLIKLGTNDSKPQNWRHGTNYVAEYEEFVGSYASLNSAPRIILCTPAPVFANGAFSINPGIVATNISPAVRALASRLGLEVVDFHERLANHPEWFPDTVHPNTRGMAVMAAIVWKTVAGGQLSPGEPSLHIRSDPGRRAILDWDHAHSGMVLQSANTLVGTNTTWTVVDSVPYRDGTRLLLTNRPSVTRFYRLWNP